MKGQLVALLFCMMFGMSAMARQGNLTYDLGVSAGSAGGQSYTEGHLGLNYFFKDYLAWRNAIFVRFPGGSADNTYGLDTSARFFLVNKISRSSTFILFGGPGYRFVSEGSNPAFLEAGVTLYTSAITLGVGVKTFFWLDNTNASDTQYFLVLAGSGRL